MFWNLAYWTYAYFWTILAVWIAFVAVKRVKSGDIQTHRRMMVLASNMMIFFIFSYVVKMLVLGREDKSNWSNFYLVVLYIHESFIGLMLIFGTVARIVARRFGKDIDSNSLNSVPPKIRKRHRFVGKAALVFAVLAIITATFVLYGMYARA